MSSEWSGRVKNSESREMGAVEKGGEVGGVVMRGRGKSSEWRGGVRSSDEGR